MSGLALQLRHIVTPLTRMIIIERDHCEGASVSVNPRLAHEPDATFFDTIEEARAFAQGISLVRDWPVTERYAK